MRASQHTVDGGDGVGIIAEVHRQQCAVAVVIGVVKRPQGGLEAMDDVAGGLDVVALPGRDRSLGRCRGCVRACPLLLRAWPQATILS